MAALQCGIQINFYYLQFIHLLFISKNHFLCCIRKPFLECVMLMIKLANLFQ
jgi:hypothetical protein